MAQLTSAQSVSDQPAAPDAESKPEIFRAAVASLTGTRVRREVYVEPLRPPQRLAPYSYAISADVRDAEGEELATGRLVLLHDPDGAEAWEGVLRLVAFASAEEAVAVLDTQPFDVLFTDVRLPGMPGTELARIVVNRFPGKPIVLASGYGRQIDIRHLGDFVEFLPKPFDLELLEAVLNKVGGRLAAQRTSH